MARVQGMWSLHRREIAIMDAMERDPHYIAETLRRLRKTFRLTQENLAAAANLSTRTIEKAESGRHCPDEQTLRSIARALGLDERVFDKPSPDQTARERAELERAIRKIAVVPTQPVRTAADFLSAFGPWHGFRVDTSAIKNDEALETAAAMADWLGDLDDIWTECSMSERLQYARSFAELCQQIDALGYVCYMGHHRQRLREKGKSDLIFEVGLMSIQAKEGAEDERYALVRLDGAWENLEGGTPGTD
jgi:transcriptional regulator with XRE-family HTH domain